MRCPKSVWWRVLVFASISFSLYASRPANGFPNERVSDGLSELSRLRVGESVLGTISGDDPVVESDQLGMTESVDHPVRGQSFSLVVDQRAWHQIEVRSFCFEPFLILRDAAGAVVLEDSESLMGFLPRIYTEILVPGEVYSVDVGSRFGDEGEFELSVIMAGSPPKPECVNEIVDYAREGLCVAEESFGKKSVQVATALNRLAVIFFELEDLDRSLDLLERAFEIRRDVLGIHPATAETLGWLGEALSLQAAHTRSIQCCRESLRMLKSIFGDEHIEVARCLNTLAATLNGVQEHEEAEQCSQESLEIFRLQNGRKSLDTAAALSNLAGALKGQLRFDEAMEKFNLSLEIFLSQSGRKSEEVAIVLSNLAGLCLEIGAFEDAEEYYRRSLSTFRKLPGENGVSIASVQCGLAAALERQGLYDEAERCYRDSVDTFPTVDGEAHPRVAQALCNHATLCSIRGDLAGARKLYLRAIEILRDGGHHRSMLVPVLNNCATLSQFVGAYAEAEALYREALEITIDTAGVPRQDLASLKENLAELLIDRGAYREAAALLDEAVAIRRELDGGFYDVAMLLGYLGRVQYELGLYAEAKRNLTEALSMFREELGEVNPFAAVYLVRLSRINVVSTGLHDDEPHLRDALEILARISRDHPRVARSCSEAASWLSELGRYGEAKEMSERALAMCRRLYGAKHLNVATSLNNFGVVLRLRGDFDEAERCFREAGSMVEDLLGPDHIETALSRGNLGELLIARGRYLDAELVIRDALKLQRSVLHREHQEVARNLGNLAGMLVMRGDYEAAAEYFREVLAIRRKLLGERHPDVATVMDNLGRALKEKGLLEEAAECHEDALALRKAIWGDKHVDVARSLNNVAGVLARRGRYKEAKSHYERALEIFEETVGSTDPGYLISQHNLGQLYETRGSLQLAENLYRAALRGRKKVLEAGHPDVAQSLASLGTLLKRKSELREAEACLEEALEILEVVRAEVLGEELDRAHFARTIRYNEVADELIGLLAAAGRFEDALAVSERVGARVLLDLLRRSGDDLVELAQRMKSPYSDSLAESLEAERKTRTDLILLEERLANRFRGSGTKSIASIENERRKLRIVLGEKTADVNAALSHVWPDAEPESINRIRGSLSREEILVYWTWTPHEVVEFIVPALGRGKIWGACIAAGRDEVGTLRVEVEELRRKLGDPGSDVETDRAALSRRLFPWEAKRRLRSAKRVIAVADGPLRDLPLDFLFGISARPDFVYVPSGSVFRNRREVRRDAVMGSSGDEKALFLGDPDFGISRKSNAPHRASWSKLETLRFFLQLLERLEATRVEVEIFSDLLEASGVKTKKLLGRNASLPRLEEEAAGVTILYLGTHGFSGGELAPYDAGLALTRPATPDADDIGFLTLDRLIRSWGGKLKGAQLVVLAACESQRSTMVGDSAMALSWGFFYAGAPTVISSLWEVENHATLLLMRRFFEGISGQFSVSRTVGGRIHRAGSKLEKGDALAEARQWLRNRSSDENLKDLQAMGLVVDGRRSRAEENRGQPPNDPTLPSEDVRSVASVHSYDYSHPHYWASFVLIGDPE